METFTQPKMPEAMGDAFVASQPKPQTVQQICHYCHGRGHVDTPHTLRAICFNCRGDGYVRVEVERPERF